MGIKQKSVHIDGEDYTISTFLATKGLSVKAELLKLGAPILFSGVKEGDEDKSIGDIVNVILAGMDKVNVVELIKTLVTCATKGTKPINFDLEFSGDYGKLYTLVKEIIIFNFASSFSALDSDQASKLNLA